MNLPELLYRMDDPAPESLPPTAEGFLDSLPGPTVILQSGRDKSRTRALCTLLHGNEPSGLRAVHRWLAEGLTPETNLVFILASVEAAKIAPMFRHRQRPGHRDQNRCFHPPFLDREGQIASAILQTLAATRPEALIDIHNTSGTGPSFGVTIRDDAEHRALTSLFTERLILTGLRLGALMEYSEQKVPTVTIECGGAQDEAAHQRAWEGLCRFATEPQVLVPPPSDWDIELLRHPVRVEIIPEASICYALQRNTGNSITLNPDIEHFNFGVLHKGQPLGWVAESGLAYFRARNEAGHDVLDQILRIEDGRIFPAQDLRTFMITTNPVIAKSDCLFYAIADHGNPL